MQLTRSYAGSIKNHELDYLRQLGEAMPFCERLDIVLSDQAEHRCIAFAASNFLNSVDCV